MERSLLVQMKGKAPDGSDQITVMDYINATREIEWVTNRMDAPGKPLLFGTTEEFLRSFGVKSLEELPELSAVQIEEFKQQAEAEVDGDVQVDV